MTALRGQVALVTGGGQGIGRALCLALAREAVDVAVGSRRRDAVERVAAEVEAAGVRGLGVVLDARDPASVETAVGRVEAAFGRVDILINNAAAFGDEPVTALDPAVWNDTLATNLTGPFLVSKAVLPGMIRRRHGSIVMVSSTSGKRATAGSPAYAASKFGLNGLAMALLHEVRKYDIRVIVVSPSAVETPEKDPMRADRLHHTDVAAAIVDALRLPQRALVREVELWATNP